MSIAINRFGFSVAQIRNQFHSNSNSNGRKIKYTMENYNPFYFIGREIIHAYHSMTFRNELSTPNSIRYFSELPPRVDWTTVAWVGDSWRFIRTFACLTVLEVSFVSFPIDSGLPFELSLPKEHWMKYENFSWLFPRWRKSCRLSPTFKHIRRRCFGFPFSSFIQHTNFEWNRFYILLTCFRQ